MKSIRNPAIKAKYDPQNRFTDYPHSIDPSIEKDFYEPVIKVYRSAFYQNAPR